MGRSKPTYCGISNGLRIGEYAAKTIFRYIPIEIIKRSAHESIPDGILKKLYTTIQDFLYNNSFPANNTLLMRSNKINDYAEEQII